MKLDAPLHDFRNFMHLCWGALSLPDPDPIQYDVGHYLQHGPKDRIICGFRGMAKTYAAVCYAMWRHRMRVHEIGASDINILVVSAAGSFADTVSRFAFQLMEAVPELRCLQPKDGQASSMTEFDVGLKVTQKDPSVRSSGIFGHITGMRADVILADDLETPNTAGTVGMQEKLMDRVAEFTDILKPGGETIILGTPQIEDTIYDKLVARGFDRRMWPARYPHSAHADLAPFLREHMDSGKVQPGDATCPRFDDEELLYREAKEGPSRFAMQFLLDPSLMDKDSRPLRLGDLIVMDVDNDVGPDKVVWSSDKQLSWDIPVYGLSGDRFQRPMMSTGEMRPYTGTAMFVDPSGRGKDETAYCISKFLNGQVFIPDFGGYKMGFEEPVLRDLATKIAQYNVNHLLVEKNFGGGMFVRLLMPYLRKIRVQRDGKWIQGHLIKIEEVHSVGQKEHRICDVLEPAMSSHRVIIDAGALRRDAADSASSEESMPYRLAFQISRVTRKRGSLKRDDRVEALAGAVGYWVESMSRDADESIQKTQDDAWQEDIDNWYETKGRRPVQPNLFDDYLRNMRQ